MHDTDAIRRDHPIANVAAAAGLELRPTGGRLAGVCPFHRDTRPSLVVYPANRSYYCFGCGAGGDVIDFVSRLHGVDFREAVALLAGTHVPPMPANRRPPAVAVPEVDPLKAGPLIEAAVAFYEDSIWSRPNVLDYLESRGIHERTVRRFRLGFGVAGLAGHLRDRNLDIETAHQLGLLDEDRECFTGRIIIPDIVAGRAIWSTGRRLSDREPRYLNLRLPKPFLGLASAQGEAVVVTEGPFDWLTAVEWGFWSVALLGTRVPGRGGAAAGTLRRGLPRVACWRRRPQRSRLPARRTQRVRALRPRRAPQCPRHPATCRMTDSANGGLPHGVLDLVAQPLDLALVRERARDDGSVFAYLEGQAIIDQANRIFGYGGWGAEVIGEPQYQAAEVVDQSSGELLAHGMYTVAVRVTVNGCPPKGDVGSGFVTERTLEAHSNAAKAAVTDAIKRAFRQFGQQFGNSLNERRTGTLASPAKLDDMRQRVVALSGRLGVDEARTRSWFQERCGLGLDDAAERELSSAIKALASELNERETQRRKAA